MMCNAGQDAGCRTDTVNVLYGGKESCLVALMGKPEIEIPGTSSGRMPYLAELHTNFSSSKRMKIMTLRYMQMRYVCLSSRTCRNLSP
jgi:hypothetical protein